MEDPSAHAFHQHPEETGAPADELGSWAWWRDLHRLLEWDRRCGVALRLCAQLPDETELERWLGEPVKCLVVPTNVFITNKKGSVNLCVMITLEKVFVNLNIRRNRQYQEPDVLCVISTDQFIFIYSLTPYWTFIRKTFF